MRNVSWFYVPARHIEQYLAGRPASKFPRKMHRHYVTGRARGKTYKPNGAREVARRLRQMGGANVQA